MHAHHLAGCCLDDDLHQHFLVALRQDIFHRPEHRLVDVEVAAHFRCFLLAHTDRTDFRLGKNCRCNQFMIRHGRIVLVERLDQAHRLVDRYRCQLHPVGHVPHRIDRWHRGSRILVDNHLAAPFKAHTGGFQPQRFGIGLAAGGKQHLISFQHIAGGQRDRALAVIQLNLFKLCAGDEAHALLLHLLAHMPADIHVETAQDFLAAQHDGHRRAKLRKNAGELQRDIACPVNDDRTRQFRQIENIIGNDTVFMACQFQHRVGSASHGNQNGLGGHLLAARLDPHGVGARHHHTGIDHFRIVRFKPLAVDAFKARDLLILVGDQRCPVESRFTDRPAIARRILDQLGVLRGIDHQLLGNTAANNAGTAKPALFRHRHLLAKRSGNTPCPHATRAAADNKKVIVELRHCLPQ